MVILKMIYLSKKHPYNYGYFEDDLSQKNFHKTIVILKIIYLKKTSIKLWWFWRWSISKKHP